MPTRGPISMRAKRPVQLLSVGLIVAFAAQSYAGGFEALSRYLRKGSYELHRREHCGYTNCQMPWQPIKSRMHPNVLPPGMHNVPLSRKWPGIAPQTPVWWRKAADPYVLQPAPAAKTSHLTRPEAPKTVQVKRNSGRRRRTFGRHADVRYRGTKTRNASQRRPVQQQR